MDRSALIRHVALCLVVGGIISYFTPAKWLATAFWVSAALYINGSIAILEDVLPGGFENPDGNDTRNLPKSSEATWFALKSAGITIVLFAAGFVIQSYF